MRYRDARLLKEGDTVVTKETGVAYTVKTTEVYGNVKTVRVNCNGASFLHTELKDNDE